VFLFDDQKTGSTVLTFNGGDAYLNEPLNIEMGFLKDNKKFEIYDIEFYKRFAQMSEKNPTRCLRCHADSNNMEARPFFHMNGSASFVTGPTPCSIEEDELQNKAQSMALQAIVKNPRFSCLDRAQAAKAQATLGNQEKNHKLQGTYTENLKRLQELFSRFEKNRLAQLIRSSPNYASYRFALIGAELCPGFKPSEWLPAEILSQHNVFSSLNPELAGIDNEDQYREALDKLKSEQEGRARGLKRILKSEFDLKRGSFRPAYQSWLCANDSDFEKWREVKLSNEPRERAFAKFQMDTKMRIFPKNERADITAALRFLLDGRGIDTSAWTLSFNPKEDLHPFEPVAIDLVALETQGRDSPLKDKSCENLKANSLKAFITPKPAIKGR